MADNCYDIGDSVHLETKVKDALGALADPTDVILDITPPATGTITFSLGAASVTRASIGVFFRDHIITTGEEGQWTYRFTTTGPIVQVGEDTFTVLTSGIT